MNSRNAAILIGAVVGAAIGGTAAWSYVKAQEEKSLTRLGGQADVQFQAGAADYVKIGVALLALVRQVTDLFRPAA